MFKRTLTQSDIFLIVANLLPVFWRMVLELEPDDSIYCVLPGNNHNRFFQLAKNGNRHCLSQDGYLV